MATVEEVILLVVSVAGLGAGAFGVCDALNDIKVLELQNGRLIVAKSNLRAQASRTLSLSLFAVAAIVSLISDEPMEPLVRTIVVVCLICIACVIAGDTILDRLARRRILAHYRIPSEHPDDHIRTGELRVTKREDL